MLRNPKRNKFLNCTQNVGIEFKFCCCYFYLDVFPRQTRTDKDTKAKRG